MSQSNIESHRPASDGLRRCKPSERRTPSVQLAGPHESGEIYVAGETGVYTKSGDEFDAAIDAIAASQQKGWQ